MQAREARQISKEAEKNNLELDVVLEQIKRMAEKQHRYTYIEHAVYDKSKNRWSEQSQILADKLRELGYEVSYAPVWEQMKVEW